MKIKHSLFALVIVGTFTTKATIEIYNSLTCPVYIALANNKQPGSCLHLQEILPLSCFHKDIAIDGTEIIAVADKVPTEKKQLDAFNITAKHDQSLILKIYTTADGNLVLIPQTSIAHITETSFGGLSLEKNISYNQILKTHISYEPQPVIAEHSSDKILEVQPACSTQTTELPQEPSKVTPDVSDATPTIEQPDSPDQKAEITTNVSSEQETELHP